jgi:hypothetical protein
MRSIQGGFDLISYLMRRKKEKKQIPDYTLSLLSPFISKKILALMDFSKSEGFCIFLAFHCGWPCTFCHVCA